MTAHNAARPLEILKAIFPPYVLALSLAPFVVGLFIHYQLVVFRELIIMLAWIPVFTLPGLLLRTKFFYYLLTVGCFVNGIVSLGHWLLIKGPVSSSSLFVLFNTNYREATGFFDLKSSYGFLLLVPYVIIFILALGMRQKIPRIQGKKNWILPVATGLFSLIFIGENAVHGRLVRKGTPVLFKATVSFYQEVKAYQQLKARVSKRTHLLNAKAFPTSQPQVCVLILGESANRNHMSLYGYQRETSPWLSKLPDLMVYDNVVSGYSHTLESVPASISEANLENHRKPYECFTLMDIFHAAGFKTYWLSNQNPLGIWDNFITILAQQADRSEFVNVSASTSFESNYKPSYDEKLFDPFISTLEAPGTKKFIVLHLMGSHSSYETRYPAAFNRFRGSATNESKVIAAYDNSILYTDFIIDSLIKITQRYALRHKAVSAVVYLSDHGENVYDEGDYAGHDYVVKIPHSNVEIPFLVWLSPEYGRIFREKAGLIRKRQHAPFVTDDLFHAVIDLFQIKTAVLIPERSLFHPSFNQHRQRILVDGNLYEKN